MKEFPGDIQIAKLALCEGPDSWTEDQLYIYKLYKNVAVTFYEFPILNI